MNNKAKVSISFELTFEEIKKLHRLAKKEKLTIEDVLIKVIEKKLLEQK